MWRNETGQIIYRKLIELYFCLSEANTHTRIMRPRPEANGRRENVLLVKLMAVRFIY